MKRLKKGFTLIELLVVIAIIGILATTLAPKLREQLAKAKDSKAVAVLGAARTAGSVALVDAMVQETTNGAVSLTYGDITSKLDEKSNDLIDDGNGNIPVGGIRDAVDGDLTYGGTVQIYGGTTALTTSDTAITVSDDDVVLTLSNGSATAASTENKLWNKY